MADFVTKEEEVFYSKVETLCFNRYSVFVIKNFQAHLLSVCPPGNTAKLANS